MEPTRSGSDEKRNGVDGRSRYDERRVSSPFDTDEEVRCNDGNSGEMKRERTSVMKNSEQNSSGDFNTHGLSR